VTYAVYPELAALAGSFLVTLALWIFMSRTDTGKAIRAVAKERQGARLMGINVDHIFAVTFGIGVACVAVAASLLVPTYAVHPQVGNLFVLIAFTVVVLGGMGSFVGALVGGFLIGITEQLGRLYLGESLGLITISVIFILVLLFRPTGLFGAKTG
jgi:branched-chain amino acid transport system permease protein